MKKLFFIIISLLTLSLALCSCSGQKNSGVNTSTNPRPSIETEFNMPLMKIIIPSDVRRNTAQEQEHINMWESYMQDKYSLKLDLMYTGRADESNNIIIGDIEAIAEEGGFIYIDYYSDLKLLIENGLIQPINEYINNSEWLRIIDKSMYGSFTDTEDNIWAVPLYEETPVSPRIYDAKWLGSAGMEVPQTVDEFYEYAKYIANNDPDRDGKKNTYITWYSYPSFTTDFKDIFRAFGCYVDSMPGSIAYNPLKGNYEIAAFNENFEDLMVYMKTLKDENLIINATQSTRDDYINKDFKIGSTNSKFFFSTTEEAYGYSLKGLNDRFFQERGMVPALVVINGTSDVTKKLNALYSILIESSDIKWDLFFGIKETDYFDMGDHYEFYKSSDHLEMLSPIDIYTRFNEAAYIDKPATWEGMGVPEGYIERSKKVLAINNAAESISEASIFYSIPYNKLKSYQQLFNLNIDIVGYEGHLYEDILVNNIPVDEAVEAFRLKMEELGIIDALNKLNGE